MECLLRSVRLLPRRWWRIRLIRRAIALVVIVVNLLGRINRELGANFDLSRFRHEVFWNVEFRRIEMHLRSLTRQYVEIPAAGLTVRLEAGETIWTESSHKYHAREIYNMAERTGFYCEAQWMDREWPFAQNLLLAQ